MDSASCLVAVFLILAGWDSYDLSRPILLSYTENIERISNPDRAFLYQAQLQMLDQHLEDLNNVRQTNISAVVDIEVA